MKVGDIFLLLHTVNGSVPNSCSVGHLEIKAIVFT